MILCLIILIAGIVALAIGVFAIYKVKKSTCFSNWDYVAPGCIMGGIILSLIAATLLIVLPVEYNKELSNFLKQKEYIENYEPSSEYDSAAITSKKIELNEWLYSEQYTRVHYPICSFFGDEILDIEPIN